MFGILLIVIISLRVIIRDLHAVRVSVPPLEAYAPLVIDGDRIFTFAIPGQRMEPISRRHLQVHKAHGRVQNEQLPSGGSQ